MTIERLLKLTSDLQTSDDARADLTVQLDELLNTLSNKFAGVSSEIFAKSKSGPKHETHRQGN